MIYFILVAVIALCLYIIISLIRKKLPILESVPIDTVKEAKQAEVKNKLLENKLKKQITDSAESAGQIFATSKNFFSKTFSKIGKIKIKRKSTAVKKDEPITEIEHSKDIEPILREANHLLRQKEIDEAEDKFIEALKIDPKNIEAYMSLGKIYVLREDWSTAEEAYLYIIKLQPKFIDGHKELCSVYKSSKKWSDLKRICEDLLNLKHEEAWVYIDLGLSNQKTGYPEKAEEYYKKAVEIEPANEEYLDYLINVAIINKNKALAERAFNTLSGLSQDESKLQSYRNKIDII